MPCKAVIKILLALGVALLAACQPLERPFQPEFKSSWIAPPGPRAALYVDVVQDGPPDLEPAVTKELQQLGIAAFTGEPIPNRYYVRGSLIETDEGKFVDWTLFDPEHRDTGLNTRERIPAESASGEWSEASVDRLARASASSIDKLLGGDGITLEEENKLTLFVPIVKGAPGDGSESLAAAIQSELVRLGLTVMPTESGATFIVRGNAEITPPVAETQVIELVWSLERRNGEQVGQIRQRNRIRAGSLNGAWGDTATLAARGGADGVYNLLRKSEPEYFKSKS